MITLKDFRISTLNERGNPNDPTHRFGLNKKEKKGAADFLMNFNFEGGGLNGGNQGSGHFEKEIIERALGSAFEEGSNIFRASVAKKYKIDLPM